MIRDAVQSGKGALETRGSKGKLQLPMETQEGLTKEVESRQSRIEEVRKAFLAKGISLDQLVLDQKDFESLSSILNKLDFSQENINTFFQGMVKNYPDGKITLSDFFKDIAQFEDNLENISSSQEGAAHPLSLDKSLTPDIESVLRDLGVTPEKLDSLLPSVVDANGNVDLKKLTHQLKEIQSTPVSSDAAKTGRKDNPVLTPRLVEAMEKMNLTSPRQSIGTPFSLDDLIGIMETKIKAGTVHSQTLNGQESDNTSDAEVLGEISEISDEQAMGDEYVDTFFAFAQEMMVRRKFEEYYHAGSSNLKFDGRLGSADIPDEKGVVQMRLNGQVGQIDARVARTGIDPSQSDGRVGQAVRLAGQSPTVFPSGSDGVAAGETAQGNTNVQRAAVVDIDGEATSVFKQMASSKLGPDTFAAQSEAPVIQSNRGMDTAETRGVQPNAHWIHANVRGVSSDISEIQTNKSGVQPDGRFVSQSAQTVDLSPAGGGVAGAIKNATTVSDAKIMEMALPDQLLGTPDVFQGGKADKRGLRNAFSLPQGKADTTGMSAQMISVVNGGSPMEGDSGLSKEIHLLIDDILSGAGNDEETVDQPGIHKPFYGETAGGSERFSVMGQDRTNSTHSLTQAEQATDTRWPSNVVETVGKEIAAFLQRGDRILKLQLKPAELGTVNIEMDTKENVVKLSIVAETSSAKEMFLSNHNELRRVLEGHGVKLESLDVQMNNSFDQSLANGDQHSARQNQRWGSRFTRTGTVDDGEVQQVQPMKVNRDALLDLMV